MGDKLVEGCAVEQRMSAWLGMDGIKLTCHCPLRSRQPRRIRWLEAWVRIQAGKRDRGKANLGKGILAEDL
jgi:hypothetical protein